MNANLVIEKRSKNIKAFILAIIMIVVAIPSTNIYAAGTTIPNNGDKIRIEAEDYEAQSGNVKIESDLINASGNKQVGDFSENCSLSFRINVQNAGYHEFFVRMTSNAGAGKYMHYRIDIDGGNSATFKEMSNTGSWSDNYQNCRVSIWLEAGEQVFTLTNITGNSFNVDCIDVNHYVGATLSASGNDVTIEAEYLYAGEGAFKFMDKDSNVASNGLYVGDFFAGSSASYEVTAPVAGTYEFGVWMASLNDGMKFEISTDKNSTTSDIINSTTAWNKFVEKKVAIHLEQGKNNIKVKNISGTWNFDKMDVRIISADGSDFDMTPYAVATGATSGNSSNLSDNNLDTYWEADGTVGESVVLRYNTPVSIKGIELFDLPESHITSGNILFSNGDQIAVGELSHQGTIIECDNDDIYWVRFDILGVSENISNSGLAQMKIIGSMSNEEKRIDNALNANIYHNGKLASMKSVLTGVSTSDEKISLLLSKEEAIDEINIANLNLPAGTYNATLALNNGSAKPLSFELDSKGFTSIDIGGLKYISSLILTIESENDNYSFSGISLIGPTADMLPSFRNYNDVYIKVRNWTGMDKYLSLSNEQVGYTEMGNDDSPSARWTLTANDDGEYTIQNEDGRYLALLSDHDDIDVISELHDNKGGLWTLQTAGDYYRIANCEYTNRKIHIENLDGKAIATSIPNANHSAMWKFETELPAEAWEHWYQFNENSVTGTAGTAVADSDTTITSNASGTERTWTQTSDLSEYPSFDSNSRIVDAVYNLSMQELKLNSANGWLNTGTSWNYVWTRDTAMSVHNSLAWIVPEISASSLKTKVVGDKENPSNPDNPGIIQQDTGTGGSYPVSDDKIIVMIATWEQYLATGDTDFLSYVYQLVENTVKQDDHLVFDRVTGLYKGETGGLDHRAKTYPNWMGESAQDGLVAIAEGKSAIVNVVYAQAMKLMAKSAIVLGKGEDAAAHWADRSEALIKAINEQLWLPERGMYSSWQYPEFMGNVNADKVDVISNGYAVLFDIAPPDRAQSILENYPLVTYGAPTVWPQKNRSIPEDGIYHNRGVWPGWEVTLMAAAKEKGYNQMAEEIWKSCLRNAAMSVTNKEVVNFSTGEGIHSDRQLWSIAGTISGYYRVLFGMSYDDDGIGFAPYVPEWLEGPFEIANYQYHGNKLTLKLTGTGDTLSSIKVDGVERDLDYKLPFDSAGDHVIELTVTDSGKRDPVNIKKINWIVCPELPELDIDGNTLIWTPDERYTYKLWNGEEFVDVTGMTSYEVDTSNYGIYSLVAVTEDGVTSEMSKPIMINDESNFIIIEAEDCEYKEGAFNNSSSGTLANYSGTGYVVDNYDNLTDIVFTVTIPEDKGGIYMFNAQYHNDYGDARLYSYCGIRSLYVDGVDSGSLVMPLSNQNWSRSSYVMLELSPGEHSIRVTYDTTNWYDRNMSVTTNNVAYDFFQLQFMGEKAEYFNASVELSRDSNSVSGKFSVENNTTESVPCSFILAVYDDKDRLVRYETVDQNAVSGTTEKIITLDISENEVAKGFICDAESYAPLMQSVYE